MIVRVRDGEAARLAPALRAVTRRIDPDVPLYRVASLEQAVKDSNWNGRVSAHIIITISTIALRSVACAGGRSAPSLAMARHRATVESLRSEKVMAQSG